MIPDSNRKRGITLLAAAFVLLASLVQSRELLDAWSHDPGSAYGLAAFSIWLFCLMVPIIFGASFRANQRWVGAAALFLVIGTLSGIALVHHLAVAASLSSFVRKRLDRWIVFCAAISWIPALGWVSHTLAGGFPGLLRLIPALGCLILLVPLMTSRRGEKKEALS